MVDLHNFYFLIFPSKQFFYLLIQNFLLMCENTSSTCMAKKQATLEKMTGICLNSIILFTSQAEWTLTLSNIMTLLFLQFLLIFSRLSTNCSKYLVNVYLLLLPTTNEQKCSPLNSTALINVIFLKFSASTLLLRTLALPILALSTSLN